MIDMLCSEHVVGQEAIERDDWPGPPEPAVAYPELCEYTVEIFATSSVSDECEF